jgi:hypothetical protein
VISQGQKQTRTRLRVLKVAATMATRTQDRTLLRVLKTVATVVMRTQNQDPPLCSEDGGNSGDAGPGPDPPLCSEDGSDSDDTGYGHRILLTSTSTSTGKSPPLSFDLSLPPPPSFAHSSCKMRWGVNWQSSCLINRFQRGQGKADSRRPEECARSHVFSLLLGVGCCQRAHKCPTPDTHARACPISNAPAQISRTGKFMGGVESINIAGLRNAGYISLPPSIREHCCPSENESPGGVGSVG